MIEEDLNFMKSAVEEAGKAFSEDEVPVGAVIVKNGEIISAAHNTVEKDASCVMHAEIKAILAAQKKLENWRLDGCTLYVTLEPCVMCCGAITLSRIARLVYGAPDPKGDSKVGGAVLSILGGKIEITAGIMEGESAVLLKDFFKMKRGGTTVA